VEALIGLFPVIGDLIGVALSSYIVNEAARLGAPKSVLARMAFNVGIEGLAGMVPFAGDVFDAAWKANQRNVALLERWLDEPKKATRSSRWFAAGLIVALIVFVTGLGALGYLLLGLIARAL
jgi:hypothetical protein